MNVWEKCHAKNESLKLLNTEYHWENSKHL